MFNYQDPTRLFAIYSSLSALGVLASCAAEDEFGGLGEINDDFELRQAIMVTDQPLPQQVIDDINLTLPEGVDATISHPELFPPSFDPNPEVIASDTEIWVTFAQEGAAFHNALGYFTYPFGDPPTSLSTQELEDGIIFSDASGTGAGVMGGGSLYNGVRMSLGSFQPGVQIGFFLVKDGACDNPGQGTCSAVGVDFTHQIFTTVDAMNLEYATDPAAARHVVMADLLNDPASDSRLLSFEDKSRLGGSDDDFNDVVFRVTATPALGGSDGPQVPKPCYGFAPLVSEAFGGYPLVVPDFVQQHIHWADLNGDGRDDFAFGNGGSLQWSIAEADGTMGPIQSTNNYLLPPGYSPHRINWVDVNGDGLVDWTYTNGGSFQIRHGEFQPDGNYGFAPLVSEAFGGYPLSLPDFIQQYIHWADLNGDGRDDFALTNGGSLQWSIAEADGTMGPIQSTNNYLLPAGYSPHRINWVDVNGDGLVDWTYTNGGSFQIRHGELQPDGSYGFAPLVSESFSGYPLLVPDYAQQHIHWTDLDGDGRDDFAFGNGGSLQWSIAEADGTMGPIQHTDNYLLPVGYSTDRVNWVDVNGDGLVDWTYTNGGSFQIRHGELQSDGSYGFAPLVSEAFVGYPLVVPNYAQQHIHWADLNGDGRDDFAFGNGGSLQWSCAEPDGTMEPIDSVLNYQLPTGYSTHRVNWVDINGDGVVDWTYTDGQSFHTRLGV